MYWKSEFGQKLQILSLHQQSTNKTHFPLPFWRAHTFLFCSSHKQYYICFTFLFVTCTRHPTKRPSGYIGSPHRKKKKIWNVSKGIAKRLGQLLSVDWGGSPPCQSENVGSKNCPADGAWFNLTHLGHIIYLHYSSWSRTFRTDYLSSCRRVWAV